MNTKMNDETKIDWDEAKCSFCNSRGCDSEKDGVPYHADCDDDKKEEHLDYCHICKEIKENRTAGNCEDCDVVNLCFDCGEWYEEEQVWRCNKCADKYSEDGHSDSDGFEDCECGYTHHYEDKCPKGENTKHYEKCSSLPQSSSK